MSGVRRRGLCRFQFGWVPLWEPSGHQRSGCGANRWGVWGKGSGGERANWPSMGWDHGLNLSAALTSPGLGLWNRVEGRGSRVRGTGASGPAHPRSRAHHHRALAGPDSSLLGIYRAVVGGFQPRNQFGPDRGDRRADLGVTFHRPRRTPARVGPERPGRNVHSASGSPPHPPGDRETRSPAADHPDNRPRP
jgi:hypothetical protein